MLDPQEILDEQHRLVELRRLVDWTVLRLRHDTLTREETRQLIEQTRCEVLTLCPGKEGVFDLVLRPRFFRIDSERRLAAWGLTDAFN
jgi:hypothetical protein